MTMRANYRRSEHKVKLLTSTVFEMKTQNNGIINNNNDNNEQGSKVKNVIHGHSSCYQSCLRFSVLTVMTAGL